jgi:tripartite-type tricarboxylate transporter receptor subunit TctC
MIFLRWVLAFVSIIFSIESTDAQTYPSKPVRLIISFTPGSSTDIVARVVMQKVSEYWGQPAVIENRAGAGGSIGSNAVATAPPDGYTLLVNSSAHSVNPAIYAKLPYDTLKDSSTSCRSRCNRTCWW